MEKNINNQYISNQSDFKESIEIFKKYSKEQLDALSQTQTHNIKNICNEESDKIAYKNHIYSQYCIYKDKQCDNDYKCEKCYLKDYKDIKLFDIYKPEIILEDNKCALFIGSGVDTIGIAHFTDGFFTGIKDIAQKVKSSKYILSDLMFKKDKKYTLQDCEIYTTNKNGFDIIKENDNIGFVLIDKGVFELHHENPLGTIFEMIGNLNTGTYIRTFSSPGMPTPKIDNIIGYIEAIGLKKIDDYTAIVVEKKSHEELNKILKIVNIISDICSKISKYAYIDTKSIRIYPYLDLQYDRAQRPISYTSSNDIHKNSNKEKNTKYKYIFTTYHGNLDYLVSDNIVENVQIDIKEIEEILAQNQHPMIKSNFLSTLDEVIESIHCDNEVNTQIKKILLDFKDKIQSSSK